MTDITSIINNIEAVATDRCVEITHPRTGEPIGLSVTLRPESSKEVEAVKRKWIDEKLLRRSGRMTADRLEEMQIALIHAAAVEWKWSDDLLQGSEQPPLTHANLRTLFKIHPFVKSRLDEELGDEAAFFQS